MYQRHLFTDFAHLKPDLRVLDGTFWQAKPCSWNVVHHGSPPGTSLHWPSVYDLHKKPEEPKTMVCVCVCVS